MAPRKNRVCKPQAESLPVTPIRKKLQEKLAALDAQVKASKKWSIAQERKEEREVKQYEKTKKELHETIEKLVLENEKLDVKLEKVLLRDESTRRQVLHREFDLRLREDRMSDRTFRKRIGERKKFAQEYERKGEEMNEILEKELNPEAEGGQMAEPWKKCEECNLQYTNDAARFPRILTCGHTFCTSCLRKHQAIGYIICPIEESFTMGYVNMLEKNYMVLQM